MPDDQRATVQRLIAERAPHKVVHESELEWKKIRWPGEWGKIAFHPSDDDPTEPLCGITRFDAGGWFPDHAHEFAQIWYVVDGECTVNGESCGPGTFVFHPDPHVERELRTEDGVTIFFVQYPGPNTGGRPVYKERFDLDARKSVEREDTTT